MGNKITQIKMETEVHQDHPELHHYTNWGGLSGILTSGELHATRYDRLNDFTEVNHFKDVLIAALCEKYKAIIIDFGRQSQNSKIKISQRGGAQLMAERNARAQIESLWENTFNILNPVKGFAVPYITSLCSHCNKHLYVSENGQLSQWRAYGGSEKYALVFDTKKLVELVMEEGLRYTYGLIGCMDVVYNDDQFNCDKRFSELLDLLVEGYRLRSIGEEPDDKWTTDLFTRLVASAARFKHRGFVEEAEVRIVACPSMPDNIRHLYTSGGYTIPDFNYKKIHTDKGKEQLHLFEQRKTQSLPIKRIIVGPHQYQSELRKKVEDITKNKIQIALSKTPYIEFGNRQ